MQEIRRAGYLLVAVFAAALSVAFIWKPTPPQRFAGLHAERVPMVIDGFQGRASSVDSVTRSALASAEIDARRYTGPGGQPIDLLLIGGTDRSALHDPRSCLVGSGGRIDDDHVESLAVGDGAAPAPVRSCVATYPGQPQYGSGYDILYFYVTHRKVIASATEIRLALLESLLEQNDEPVYFVRVLTPYASGGGYAAEHARLVRFTSAFWKHSSSVFIEGSK